MRGDRVTTAGITVNHRWCYKPWERSVRQKSSAQKVTPPRAAGGAQVKLTVADHDGFVNMTGVIVRCDFCQPGAIELAIGEAVRNREPNANAAC